MYSWRALGRIAATGMFLACTLVACSEHTEPGVGDTDSLEPASAFLVFSDSAPAAGSTVTVTAYAPRLGTERRISSYEARLQFDTTDLTFLSETASFTGSRAVNAAGDMIRTAGASTNGSDHRKLFSIEFQVERNDALASLRFSIIHLASTNDANILLEMPLATRGTIVLSPESTPLQYGDIDGDGTITASDARLILQIASGLTAPTETTAITGDMNDDGKVSAIDAQIVLSYVVGENVRRFRIGDLVNTPVIRITSISPAVLRPGIEAVITGENFASVAEDDTVTIDDLAASVLSASPTQLTVRVPASLPCEPAHSGSILVRARGGGGHLFHPVSAAASLPIAVGQTRFLGPNDNISCLEIPENAKYIMAVYNPTNTRMLAFPFNVIGGNSQGVMPLLEQRSEQHMALPQRSPRTSIVPPAVPMQNTSVFNIMRNVLGAQSPASRLHTKMQQHQVAHQRMMEKEYDLLRRLRARGATPLRRNLNAPTSRTTAGASSSDVPPSPALSVSTTVGTYSSVKIHDVDSYNTYTTIRARTVYVGTNCIVLEDSASALAGAIDSYYSKIGMEFDQIAFPMLQQYFGNPLAMDASMDNNGRIIMLFSPVVNQKFPQLSGFVTSCDFFSTTICPSSNQAEIFYAEAPLNAATNYSDGSVSGWFWTIRSIIPHEAKHITSVAERMSRGGYINFETAWLEEGTAQIASELYGRHFYGTNAPWKGNAVYANTIYCELRPTWAECKDYPTVMLNHFGWLSEYAWNTDALSPINSSSGTIYGSAWLLTRWAADTYASNEAAFFRALTQQSTDTGIVNLTARTGTTWPDLLSRWALAFAGDEVRSTGSTQNIHHIPSWNLPNIFQEMSKDLAGSTSSIPLRRTKITGGNFSTQRAAAGGSFSIFDIELNADFRQTIGVVNTTGGKIPANVPLSVAIWRVQ